MYLIVSKSDRTTFFHKISKDKSNIYFFKIREQAEEYKLKHLYKPEDFEVVDSTEVDVDKIIDSMIEITQIDKVIIGETE